MRLEHLPVIEIKLVASSSRKELITHEVIEINNIGAPLQKFNYSSYVFLDINYYSKNNSSGRALIPVFKYYNSRRETNKLTGRLVQLSSFPEGNRLKAHYLNKEYYTFAKQHNAYVHIDIKQYISIWYEDIMDIKHYEVYYVSLSSIYKLSEIERKEIFEQHNDRIIKRQFVNLWNTSVQELYNKWLLIITEPN